MATAQGRNESRFSLIPQSERIGTDSDWKSIAVGPVVFALKHDGTLWGFLPDSHWQIGRGAGAFRNDPVQLGTDSDWSDLFQFRYDGFAGVKNDGSVWRWSIDLAKGFYERWIQGLHPERVLWDSVDGTGVVKLLLGNSQNFKILLRKDGTLWGSGDLPEGLFGQDTEQGGNSRIRQIGVRSDWLAIEHSDRSFLGIWRGNKLLRADVGRTSIFWPGNLQNPSRYSDWIAVHIPPFKSSRVALAADGTLSAWEERSGDSSLSDSSLSDSSLFGPTRKPFWSINILEQTNMAETAK